MYNCGTIAPQLEHGPFDERICLYLQNGPSGCEAKIPIVKRIILGVGGGDSGLGPSPKWGYCACKLPDLGPNPISEKKKNVVSLRKGPLWVHLIECSVEPLRTPYGCPVRYGCTLSKVLLKPYGHPMERPGLLWCALQSACCCAPCRRPAVGAPYRRPCGRPCAKEGPGVPL